jgi:hypothetical protein
MKAHYQTHFTNGVKQGCVLAPTLFSLMFSSIFTDAFPYRHVMVDLLYRTDGKLFNTNIFQAKTKVRVEAIREFLCVDDCALNAGTEQSMQISMDHVCLSATTLA